MPSKGIFLEAEGGLSIRDINETYKPTGSESLVNVKYSAINPADIRHAFMGMFGTVTGYEFVGDVLEVGPESPFKVGQEVFGLSRIAAGKPQHIGSHQDYLLADA
jgi:NADPH:quinone reductase-like Zn-dependent oxidoreductase